MIVETNETSVAEAADQVRCCDTAEVAMAVPAAEAATEPCCGTSAEATGACCGASAKAEAVAAGAGCCG
jgi:hypothetical protein